MANGGGLLLTTGMQACTKLARELTVRTRQAVYVLRTH